VVVQRGTAASRTLMYTTTDRAGALLIDDAKYGI